MAILLPIGFFLLSLGQALEQLSQMQVKLSQGTLTSAQVAETHDQFQRLEQLTKPVNVETLNSAVSIGLQLTGVGRHSVNVIKLGKDLSGSIFAGQTIPLADTLDNMEQELELLKSETARTSSSLSQLSDSRFMNLPLLRPLGKRLTNGGVRLNDGLSYLNLAQTMLPIISYIAGADGKRVYLILLQNNMELRPAGGFIGSYGLVTFAGGKLKNLIIEDIYSADGQLRGHIDPPLPLQKYLGLEHWYLRDSNFQPDFFESAKMAEWFLRKEIGIDVDGVIALDLTFAKRMLEALGGIDLPDYNERITASNFFLKAQVAAEADFFPGSTNKRDFLGRFARAFIRELTSGSSLPWMRLAYAVKTSLDEKHLQLSFHDPRVQGVFDQAGWSGRLLPVVCPEDNSRLKCLADYVSVVDANVGVNKANYYLKRDFEHEVKIDKDYLSHQITVYYSNESPGETFPSGTYRTFTRVYLAKEADNIEIFFQGQKREAKDLTSDISHDKVIIGTYLEVLPQQRYQLQVRYNLPLPSSPFLYQLLLQKQAGTEHDSLHLKLSSDKKIRSSNIAIDKLTAVDYNSDLAIDRLFRFEIE
ncbi:DUF4012 domain-containing protein [Candidatus Gottesmanbacteria bacterium]|nr:DUF4012 domain-containing protein [Candidatus Gottesmanbacteria bacterium]